MAKGREERWRNKQRWLEHEGRRETQRWHDAVARADAMELDAEVGASVTRRHGDGRWKQWCWVEMAMRCLVEGEKGENGGGEREMVGGGAPILYWCMMHPTIAASTVEYRQILYRTLDEYESTIELFLLLILMSLLNTSCIERGDNELDH